MDKVYVTGIIDITAHSIRLFDERNESSQNIKDTFMNKAIRLV